MNENGSFKNKKVYFSQVSNTALRDENLSLKAKGLYSLIQSYITIENFILYKTTLKKQCKEKEKAFESTWKELKDNGYLIQERYRKPDGTFGYIYDLLDISNHTPEKQGVDNAGGGKGGIYNNTDLNNTYSKEEKPSIESYYESIKKGSLVFPELQAIREFEALYSFDIIIKAIDTMVLKGRGPSLDYVDKVLKDWHSKNLTTVEAVDLYLSEREIKREKKRKSDEKKRTEVKEHKDKKESSFNNYEQREYDFDNLEKKLLGWTYEELRNEE